MPRAARCSVLKMSLNCERHEAYRKKRSAKVTVMKPHSACAHRVGSIWKPRRRAAASERGGSERQPQVHVVDPVPRVAKVRNHAVGSLLPRQRNLARLGQQHPSRHGEEEPRSRRRAGETDATEFQLSSLVQIRSCGRHTRWTSQRRARRVVLDDERVVAARDPHRRQVAAALVEQVVARVVRARRAELRRRWRLVPPPPARGRRRRCRAPGPRRWRARARRRAGAGSCRSGFAFGFFASDERRRALRAEGLRRAREAGGRYPRPRSSRALQLAQRARQLVEQPAPRLR